MPILRQSPVDALRCAAELLSHLQIGGYLHDLKVPAWAEGGTGVEELILALRMLGDGRWLSNGVNPNIESLADRWVEDFLMRRKVASPYDDAGQLEALLSAAAGVDLHESVDSLCRYLKSLPGEMLARIVHRLHTDLAFPRAALAQMHGLILTLESCAVSPEETYDEDEHGCLRDEAIDDPDVLAMALKMLEDERAFDAMGAYGVHFVNQGKRKGARFDTALALSGEAVIGLTRAIGASSPLFAGFGQSSGLMG